MAEQTLSVEYLVVHHSASAKETTCSEIRQWHLERGWDDIGYHWIIGDKGELTAGRAENVVGAHAKGLNFKSLGICCIGNFELASPSSAAVAMLVETLTSLCHKYRVAPGNIIGHRDVIKLTPEGTDTLCPGQGLYILLPQLRSQVGERLKLTAKPAK